MKSQLDMKSQLEETKQKIKELLKKKGFSTDRVSINPLEPDKIYVVSERDDMPKEIHMTIRRSEHNWYITMSGDDRPCDFKDDEEKMLKFIEKKLQELVKCCG